MGEQADYIVDKIIFGEIDKWVKNPHTFLEHKETRLLREFEECDFWTTASGDVIYYHQLEEGHARNILKQIERSGMLPNPKLLKRIAYFDSLKPQWKELF